MSKNERITENIVREKLQKAGITKTSGFVVDEQKSLNPLIKKLLATASKSGKGVGKPEFIISSPKVRDFILIIECKADAKKHWSATRDQFKDFAVDGVLLYSAYLAKEFNVISIAVSGQNEQDLKIEVFLQAKGAPNALPLKDDGPHRVLVKDIVSWETFLRYGLFDETITEGRKRGLNKFSRDLHNYLRDYAHITEAQKPLLVSGILLALMKPGFKASFGKYEGVDLARETFRAISDIINQAKLGVNQEEKKKAVINSFRFVEDHPELQRVDKNKNESPLAHIIKDIDREVRPFTQTHYDYDVIGDFYGEFIRYTGGDRQGLGIVLTPKHITELFSDLAKLNKNSVVLDTCCGTGGFLISAMKKMTRGVSEAEKIKILENSLIGVEQEPSMFALAVSNMILRGDGKTNLYQGSCFDHDIFNQVKNKATAGFINPPYSQKGENLHEWNFVITLLDGLQKNATGIVIVPMSLAIASHPLRERLLKEHRLEAVMSMPDDLFYPTGTTPCVIMVFTAHTPHNSDEHHETWFGYWKDDGFVKIKKEGRIATSRWKAIRESWILSYRKKELAGKSVWKKVGLGGQWCAEVYLETDYSTLTENDFRNTILRFAAFRVQQGDLSFVRKLLRQKNEGLKITDRNWRWFKYPDVFEVIKGHYNNRPELDKNGVPFISATESNNGITDYVAKEGTKIFPAKSITVSNDGSVAIAFYQEKEFTCSHSVNIIRIHPKYGKELNPCIAFFLIPLIEKEKYRFNYGFKWRIERMLASKIKLPVDAKGEPDWQFMENYIKSLPYSGSI